MVNALLLSSGLLKNCWGEALYSGCMILNLIPYKKSDDTPYEIWKDERPSLKFLKVWGCLTNVNKPIVKKRQIGPKNVDCAFVYYSLNSTTYRF